MTKTMLVFGGRGMSNEDCAVLLHTYSCQGEFTEPTAATEGPPECGEGEIRPRWCTGIAQITQQ